MDPREADRHWHRWTTAPWFHEGIDGWLAVRGMPESEFRDALGAVDPPNPGGIGGRGRPVVVRGDDPDGTATWFLKPMARGHVQELFASAGRWRSAAWWPGAGDAERIEAELTRELADRLGRIAVPCIVTEINIRRLRADFVATTPAGRAAEFAADLVGPSARLDELLAHYPVLDELWHHEARRWKRELRTLFTRLDRDHPELGDVTGAGPVGRLVSVSTPLGDPHRGGLSVRTLGFSDGSEIVYKPRPLTGEQWYASLAATIEQLPGCPGIRAPRVLVRAGWGWQELIRTAALPEAELPLFYRRFGWIIAISHAFSVVDLHAENLIAAGAHPVLVDLEAVAHPVLTEPALNGTGPVDETSAEQSVLLSMLLPAPHWTGGVDFSAVSAGRVAATMSTTSAAGLAGDSPRMVTREVTVRTFENRPRLTGGALVDPLDHLDDILAGFRDGYRSFVDARSDLLAPDGPLLRQLRAGPLRFLVRPTRVYAQALQQSTHPGLMADAVERELYLSHLWGRRRSAPHRRLAGSEVEDLLDLDIPAFTFSLDSRALSDARGRIHADFFPATPSALLESHFATLSEKDLRAQEWAIEATMRAAGDRPRPAAASATGALVDPTALATRPEELVVASALRWLRSYQIDADRGPTWFGMRNIGGQRVPDLVGETLYDGRAGIGLFLAAAARCTGDRRAHTDAEAIFRALSTTLERTDDDDLRRIPAGAWEGLSGVLWSLVIAADLLQIEPMSRDLIGRCARILATPAEPDDVLDVIGGSAGIALSALAISRHGYPEFDAVAAHAGSRLLATAGRDGAGLSWPLGGSPELGMTGFAHGNAGIAAALGRLHAHFDDDAYRRAAEGAITWENGHFDPAGRGWHDLRGGVVHPPGMVAWCHGVPGIVLGHTMARGEITPEHRRLLLDAVTGRESAAVGLCHGSLGNIDTVLAALGSDPVARQHVRASATIVAERILEREITGDEHSGMPTPGLMPGIAGLGYAVLRLQHPDVLPSLLAMGH